MVVSSIAVTALLVAYCFAFGQAARYAQGESHLGPEREPESFFPSPLLLEPVRPPRLSFPPEQAQVVDSKPVLLNAVRPNYTIEARRNRVEGVVILRMEIDVDGKVKIATVVRGLPDGLIYEAIAAAKKLKFKPAMKDGKPVPYSTRVEIAFSLRDK
jgi:TonB family protein